MRYEEFTIEGRNAVIEAYRAGRPIDKLFILDGCQDGPILTIKREAKAKHRSYFYWITLKIRTTSARSSEPPTWRAHTA